MAAALERAFYLLSKLGPMGHNHIRVLSNLFLDDLSGRQAQVYSRNRFVLSYPWITASGFPA